jgi:hypothetical protein
LPPPAEGRGPATGGNRFRRGVCLLLQRIGGRSQRRRVLDTARLRLLLDHVGQLVGEDSLPFATARSVLAGSEDHVPAEGVGTRLQSPC